MATTARPSLVDRLRGLLRARTNTTTSEASTPRIITGDNQLNSLLEQMNVQDSYQNRFGETFNGDQVVVPLRGEFTLHKNTLKLSFSDSDVLIIEFEISCRIGCKVSISIAESNKDIDYHDKDKVNETLSKSIESGFNQKACFDVRMPIVEGVVEKRLLIFIDNIDSSSKKKQILSTLYSVEIHNNSQIHSKMLSQQLKDNLYGSFVIFDVFGNPEKDSNSSNEKDKNEQDKEVQVVSSSDSLNSLKECIVCLSEERSTIVLPCRHMCLCKNCAEALRQQTSKCPICRQGFHSLLHLRVRNKIKEAS